MNKSHKDKSIYDKIPHPKTILTALTRECYILKIHLPYIKNFINN